MAWYHEVRAALAAVFLRRSQERELREEMQFHLDMETQYRAGRGMDEAAARAAAKRAFGGEARYADDVRDERGARAWDQFRRDVSLAVRSLRHRIGFTTLVVITLALGIGATTTLFGVVRAVLLTPLPYRDPQGLVVLWSAWKGFDQTWLSWDEYEAWDADIRSFSDVALFSDGAITLSDGDMPERVRFASVSASLLPVLGVTPILGRGFSEAEDLPNGDRVILLSHTLWQQRFGADPSIVGRPIQVDGAAATVIGVMPPGFRLPLDFGADGPTLAWMPLATSAEAQGAVPGPAFQQGGGSHGFYALARLAPGATVESANRDLATKVAALRTEGVYQEDFRAYAVGVTDQVSGRIRPVLLVTFGAVALLLLIACANVAALLLVRGEHRRRELAVRVALGAGTSRLARLLLTESAVLAAAGGLAGVGVATLGMAGVRRFAPAALPRMSETQLDGAVLLAALVASAVTALLAGLLPALQASRVAPAGELKEGGRSATQGAGRLRWRQALVTGEIALAVVVVAGAGLMVRTVRNLLAIDRGFDGRGVLTMRISTPSTWYGDSVQVARFWRDLTRQVGELPQIASAGGVRQVPLASEMGDWGLQVEGYTPPPNQGTPGDWQVVTPGYFETMGLKLVEGRFLDSRDGMASPLALVVNTGFVKAYLDGRTALGARVRIGGGGQGQVERPWYTIVGVVEDVRHNGLTRTVKPQFYATLEHFALQPGSTRRTMHLVARADGDPQAVIGPIRQVVRALDPRLPISDIRVMDEVIDTAIAEQRFAMQLLSIFGMLALLLSTVGVFGVVSQIVSQRAQEFGIRAALGATPRQVVAMSLQAGVRQAAVGIVLGIAGALAATRVLGGLLHGVGSTDPLTFVSVAVLTLATTFVASVLPAWRAAQRSPATVLFES